MTYGRGRAEQFRLHPTLGLGAQFRPAAVLPVPAGAARCLLLLTHIELAVPCAARRSMPLAVLPQGMALAAGGRVLAEPGCDAADCV